LAQGDTQGGEGGCTAAVLTMNADAAAFLETLKQTLSADNALRNAAEKRYEDARRDQPAQTVVALFQVVREAQVEQPVREQAAVLLRQCLSKANESDSIWAKLDQPGQAELRASLLQMLEAEPLPPVRRKVADCVHHIANQIIQLLGDQRPKNAGEWPELMPALMRTIVDGGKDAGVRVDCLFVVKEMTCSVWQILVASSDQTLQVLRTCLADPAEAVRAMAAALLCNLVDQIESREDRKPFSPLIPEVSGVIAQLAASSDPKHLNEVLQALQTTSESVDFFKNHIGTHLMPVLVGIAKSHSDESARKSAFEVIICFVESKPKAVLKTPSYVEQALEVCVHFMMELDDDLEAWAADDEEGGEDDEETFSFGKEAVDRICRCASKVDAFPQVLEVLKPAIQKLFESGAWKQVVAGVVTLAQIAEYVDDEATVVQMVTGIAMQLRASHARVRYVAWSAIAQFSTDHAEVITTDTWSAKLLPEFVQAMDDACVRVQLRSMEAFQHYGESVEREDLEPFMQPLMERLGQLLQGKVVLQKKAITFIAVLTGQLEDAFAPYYGPLMPILKQVIQATLHKVEERTLLGKCFECISLLAKSVGRQGFKADAEVIMEAMVKATQVPNLPSNDPVKEYMMAAAERICSTMKEDFLPFVPHILPGVLEKLTLAPREFDADNNDLLEGAEVNLTLTQENGKMKFLLMYSSEMQDLKAALECLHTFVDELGKVYAPFVAQTAKALLPVFGFSMAEEIRDLAFETWAQLCGCSQKDGQAGVTSELVMELLKRILPEFEATDVDILALRTRADGVTNCLKKAGPGILSADQVRHICQTAMRLLGESLQRREEGLKERREMAAAAAAAGEIEEDFEDEGEEQALREAICEIAGAVMEHHPDTFVAEGLASHLALAQKFLQPNLTTDDHKLALFIVCNLLEHLGSRITSEWPKFMPQMLETVMHEAPELRQPACYGISLAAKDPAFAAVAGDAAKKLAEVVTQSRKRSKKKSDRIVQACADNALSALVNILLNHEAALGALGAELWEVWLAGLPCQEDEQEGERNHKILLQLTVQDKPEIVGAGGQYLPRLLTILIDVYKTDMVEEETSKGIGQLALRLGEARLEHCAQGFSEKRRKKLLRIVREAQKEATEQPATAFNPPPRT